MTEEKTSNQHQVVERRVLAPNQTAVLLANGNLTLAESKRGVQITIDAYAAYDLLDMLYQHKEWLHQITHQEGNKNG